MILNNMSKFDQILVVYLPPQVIPSYNNDTNPKPKKNSFT